MGPINGGEIESHLETIREAVTEWLSYEDPIPVAGLDPSLAALSVEDLPQPDQPEILRLMRLSKNFNVPMQSGSYNDWPYLFSLELNACLESIRDYTKLKLTNLELALNKAKQ